MWQLPTRHFFADYPARHAELLAYQDAGTDRLHVLTTDDGTIAGRVNLICITDGEAELGYRIGQEFAGRGLATEAVRQVCELARAEYGLTRLRARTTDDNAPSVAVLLRGRLGVAARAKCGANFCLLRTDSRDRLRKSQ